MVGAKGRPSEEGLYQDALGAHDYLTRTRMIRPERIVLFGRSLGAAVAGELAAQKPAEGLILESSFPSIEAVAKFHYGGLPVHWLLGADFTLIDRLPQLSLPKLIIHGDKDDIIPLELGRQVFEAAKPPKSFYVIPGADHNNTYQVGGAAYFRRWAEFIQAASNPRSLRSNPCLPHTLRLSVQPSHDFIKIDWRLPRHLVQCASAEQIPESAFLVGDKERMANGVWQDTHSHCRTIRYWL